MNQLTSSSTNPRIAHVSVTALTTLGLVFVLAQAASAATINGFTSSYALSNWTATSTNSALTSSGIFPGPSGASFKFTGNGSSNAVGDITFSLATSLLPATSNVLSFNWNIVSALPDVAVYLVRSSNNVAASIYSGGVTPPTTATQSSFSFNSGETIGLRFQSNSLSGSTFANGPAATLTVNDFTVQENVSNAVATPFEFSPALGLGVIGAWVGYRRWQRQHKN